ncbi:TonB-dependent receptor [Hyphococcus flavus]|uniref:TonB-dependent receptor n=1 Tax=Hyphococcus flavus TaxID=1866326 RepID=A0AAE9ZJN1_9PROT|nr:TonB-dependent receptor [Hyphococcus flavus]WDI32346.1 TonB-dependent receptor [Hyphococcus flavus]
MRKKQDYSRWEAIMAVRNQSFKTSMARKTALLAFCSTFSLSAGGTVVYAQDEASDASSDRIVVTARRREESLQDVPLAVSAYTGDQLDELGAQDLTDIEALSPNVTLETSRATNTTLTAFIRGVGQQDPVSGFEAGVGIYIDDVYLNRPQAALLDIYDVERVEVLRGPQGTLYGRNTIGGAVKYVTRRLDDEPEARLRLTGGTYGQIDAVGTFNLPLMPENASGGYLRAGGAIAYMRRNGFGDNLVNGLENYNKDILAGRLTLDWGLNDAFSIRVTGDWTEDNSDPRQGHRLLPYTDLTVMPAVTYPVLDNVFDTRAGLNTPEQSVVARGVSATAEWQVSDEFTLKNIISYRDDETTTPIDFDSLPIVDLDVPGIYDNKQFSEEFQILYEGDRLSGIAGFYYLDAEGLTVFDVVLDETAPLLMLAGLNAFTSSDVSTKSWSVFGDFTFDLTDTVSISAGGRYTEDERSISLLRTQYFTPGFSPSFGGPDRAPDVVLADLDASATFTDFSPRASITWEPSPEHTLYASYSQGFKGGSFDPRCGANAAPDLDGDGMAGAVDIDDQIAFCRFEPENINTYEVGWKNSLGGGRFNSNLALFYSGYKDVQVPGSIGIDADMDGIAETFAGVTTNAAEATLYGLELDGLAVLAEDMAAAGDSLSYQFTLGYINAEFDEYTGRTGTDISDVAVFQNTPSITAFSRLSYQRPASLFGKDGDANVSTSFSYRSFTNQFNYASPLDQPEVWLWNAGLGWTAADGKVKLSVHGKNLLNKEYVVAGYDFVTTLPEFGNSALGLSGVLTTFYGNPRQVFGTIEVAF